MAGGRVAMISYDMTKGVDLETQTLMHSVQESGRSMFLTTTIPEASYARMEAEVASLTPKQRKKWKTTICDNFGQKTSVRYNEAGISIPGFNFVSNFENKMSGQKQGKMQTNQEWRPVKPSNLTVVADGRNVVLLRRGNDAALDGLPSSSQSEMLHAERVANHTGNHEPRNHSIAVPTRAGEPVRG